jgi:isopentenyl-diphosphate delta-isomerase
MEMLILVDEKDNEIGYEEKEPCHRWPAKLHRAFSIFVFDSSGRMFIHKRASNKKTWPNFWTNACCSHPRKGEKLEDAVKRRLKEELGFTCPLKEIFSFVYSAKFDNAVGENEFDHVFVGTYDGQISPDKTEIAEWKFVTVSELKKDIEQNPQKYTPWFKTAYERVIKSRKD